MQQRGMRAPDGEEKEELRNMAGFWLLGLFNNAIYCVILAGAKEIEAGGVGIVFLAMQVPGLLVKTTGPFWYHLTSYRFRTLCVTILACAGLVIVACSHDLETQLAGVALCSVQQAIGEATYLALTSLYVEPKATVTAWSSGTGFSGIMGFCWVLGLRAVGISYSHVLFFSLSFPTLLLASYHVVLRRPVERKNYVGLGNEDDDRSGDEEGIGQYQDPGNSAGAARSRLSGNTNLQNSNDLREPMLQGGRHEEEQAIQDGAEERRGGGAVDAGAWRRMGWRERAGFVASLWPYMVPLYVVYLAEYVMQAGAWSAIGFPPESRAARDQFYKIANLCYQGGVFISRSSGLLVQLSMPWLWVMPALQGALLAFFVLDALYMFWYDWSVLPLCVAAGLLGGTVYVQGFGLLSREAEPGRKELALAAASMAGDLGVATADMVGLIVQGCIYKFHHLDSATFHC